MPRVPDHPFAAAKELSFRLRADIYVAEPERRLTVTLSSREFWQLSSAGCCCAFLGQIPNGEDNG